MGDCEINMGDYVMLYIEIVRLICGDYVIDMQRLRDVVYRDYQCEP